MFCYSKQEPNRNDHIDESLQTFKEHICQTPLLLQYPSKPYEFETNASDNVVGSVLYQHAKPVAFESKKLTPTQCWYSIQGKELFAIMHALKSWRRYLCGNLFVVTTDH